MWLASVTEKVAVVPLNPTLVAPVKFVPVIVTLVPTMPLVGEKLVMVGAAAFTVKLFVEVAVPTGVTITIFPVTAAAGTVSVTLVLLATEKVVAGIPPTATEVAPVKFVPLTVTEVPTVPLVGLKLVIEGFAGGGGGFVFPLTDPLQAIIAAPLRIKTHARGRLLPARDFLKLIFLAHAKDMAFLSYWRPDLIYRASLPERTDRNTQAILTLEIRIDIAFGCHTCPEGQFSASRVVI
ncbi:MAG TPA: hypothetical protein VEU98_04225 [Candidatus Eremiobacteraceae bacterium]|nr:hypothetical protein [Candidatus Eremiobacteraceae bacterium]